MLNLFVFAFCTELRHSDGIRNEYLKAAVNQCCLQLYVVCPKSKCSDFPMYELAT